MTTTEKFNFRHSTEPFGLRHGHPTKWKFRHWSPHYDKLDRRRLVWVNGVGRDGGYDLGARGPLLGDPVIDSIFEDSPWQYNNLTDEGETDFVDVYFDDQAVRANTYIRGYNDTIVETDTLATALNEQSGSGYSALTYARGTNWTAATGAATGDTLTWSASGAWIAMTDVILATVSTGTAGLAIAYVALSQTRTLANGETLDVTPTVTVS